MRYSNMYRDKNRLELSMQKDIQICISFDYLKHILLYKVVRFFCLYLKISVTTEPIEISILWKLFIGPWMVLGYLIFVIEFVLGYFPAFLTTFLVNYYRQFSV